MTTSIEEKDRLADEFLEKMYQEAPEKDREYLRIIGKVLKEVIRKKAITGEDTSPEEFRELLDKEATRIYEKNY